MWTLREKNLFAIAKHLVFSLCLFFFASFLALGNLPRIIESSFFSDHLLFSEITLYVFSVLSLFFIKAPRLSWLKLSLLSFLVICSFSYGVFLQGMDLPAGLYALRLLALIATSFSLTAICLERFQSNLTLFFSFLLKTYTVALALGLFLFLSFFSSEALWQELRLYNILFHGDPHKGRFVSVYFDPNYYAAIVGMPMLMAYYLFEKTGKTRYRLLLGLLGLSALLTWSRSGLFTLGAVFMWLIFFPLDLRGFSQKKLKGLLLFLGLGILSSIVFWEELSVFMSRLLFIGKDPSALSRLYTFEWGISFWKEHPLFGIGYNFLHAHVKEEIGLNSLDSSLLSFLIQIGMVPFLGICFLGIYKIQSLKKAISYAAFHEKKLLKGLVFYGFLILFFASQFNQLLFYPFWFLPFMVTLLFCLKSTKKESEEGFSSDSHGY